jgi:hypothetical protein
MYATPKSAGIQPPAPEPRCGTRLPSIPGNPPCDDPAAWHIRWTPGGDGTFPASLACHTHMEQLARAHAWYERHPATPACSSPEPTWQPNGCTT